MDRKARAARRAPFGTAPGRLSGRGLAYARAFTVPLVALVAACVGLHPFMRDGVTWQLCDRRLADVVVHAPPATLSRR